VIINNGANAVGVAITRRAYVCVWCWYLGFSFEFIYWFKDEL